jgi:hypothetical protein
MRTPGSVAASVAAPASTEARPMLPRFFACSLNTAILGGAPATSTSRMSVNWHRRARQPGAFPHSFGFVGHGRLDAIRAWLLALFDIPHSVSLFQRLQFGPLGRRPGPGAVLRSPSSMPSTAGRPANGPVSPSPRSCGCKRSMYGGQIDHSLIGLDVNDLTVGLGPLRAQAPSIIAGFETPDRHRLVGAVIFDEAESHFGP